MTAIIWRRWETDIFITAITSGIPVTGAAVRPRSATDTERRTAKSRKIRFTSAKECERKAEDGEKDMRNLRREI